ncbi:MBL fold metallo-hydrolase [Ekhidna sp.]
MKYLLALLITLPSLTFAQRNWDAIEVKVNKVSDNISYLVGSGGNIGVIHGNDGVLIIDDQFAPLSEKIKQAVKTLSSEDIKYVLNTHYHGDHSGGNENFKNDGAIIVAQDMVRQRLSTTFTNEVFGREMPAKPDSYLPTITFSKDMTFHFNDEEMKFVHSPSAHTDGDAIIHFKTSNIIHAGDCFVRYGYPYIDISAGGSIDGMIDAQRMLLKIADAETKIIPGHGELASIKEVQELLEMLLETKKIVSDAKDSGESLGALVDRKPFAKFHEDWSGSFIDSDLFVKLIYESL